VSDVEEEYAGTVRLLLDDRELTAYATLAGHFEPISGTYQWSGRLRADDTLRAAVRPNTALRVALPDRDPVDATVREEDPWGGFRVSGAGRPPFGVPSERA
jgi:hypothetical protein